VRPIQKLVEYYRQNVSFFFKRTLIIWDRLPLSPNAIFLLMGLKMLYFFNRPWSRDVWVCHKLYIEKKKGCTRVRYIWFWISPSQCYGMLALSSLHISANIWSRGIPSHCPLSWEIYGSSLPPRWAMLRGKGPVET
jgi:hypothetical protein